MCCGTPVAIFSTVCWTDSIFVGAHTFKTLCSKGQSKDRCVLVTLLYWCELLNGIIIVAVWWSFLTSKFDNSDLLLSVVRVNLIRCCWIFSAFNVIFEWEYWNSWFPVEVIGRFYDFYLDLFFVLYGSYLRFTAVFMTRGLHILIFFFAVVKLRL